MSRRFRHKQLQPKAPTIPIPAIPPTPIAPQPTDPTVVTNSQRLELYALKEELTVADVETSSTLRTMLYEGGIYLNQIVIQSLFGKDPYDAMKEICLTRKMTKTDLQILSLCFLFISSLTLFILDTNGIFKSKKTKNLTKKIDAIDLTQEGANSLITEFKDEIASKKKSGDTLKIYLPQILIFIASLEMFLPESLSPSRFIVLLIGMSYAMVLVFNKSIRLIHQNALPDLINSNQSCLNQLTPKPENQWVVQKNDIPHKAHHQLKVDAREITMTLNNKPYKLNQKQRLKFYTIALQECNINVMTQENELIIPVSEPINKIKLQTFTQILEREYDRQLTLTQSKLKSKQLKSLTKKIGIKQSHWIKTIFQQNGSGLDINYYFPLSELTILNQNQYSTLINTLLRLNNSSEIIINQETSYLQVRGHQAFDINQLNNEKLILEKLATPAPTSQVITPISITTSVATAAAAAAAMTPTEPPASTTTPSHQTEPERTLTPKPSAKHQHSSPEKTTRSSCHTKPTPQEIHWNKQWHYRENDSNCKIYPIHMPWAPGKFYARISPQVEHLFHDPNHYDQMHQVIKNGSFSAKKHGQVGIKCSTEQYKAYDEEGNKRLQKAAFKAKAQNFRLFGKIVAKTQDPKLGDIMLVEFNGGTDHYHRN